jgi:hypothetical protein
MSANEDTLLYRTAREVLDGEYEYLESELVGIQELARRGTAGEAEPIEDTLPPVETVVERSTADIR